MKFIEIAGGVCGDSWGFLLPPIHTDIGVIPPGVVMGWFREHVESGDGMAGYILSSLMTEVSAWLNGDVLVEGRPKREVLASKDFTYKQKKDPHLFGTEFIGSDPLGKVDRLVADEGPKGPDGETCQITPLSGYASHIGTIQAFARSSPQNFAQVLMFSPLSANTPFAKHWDNFHMLMSILKHQYPDRVTAAEITAAAKSFDDKYHKLSHTLSGWKYDTIADVWSNKEGLFRELNQLAGAGDDAALIRRLCQIKGVKPVKAGFIVQLLWGRAGCIDTHNIDIYSKVFPGMHADGDFNEKKWSAKKGGAEKYLKMLGKLDKEGIGTKELWDVWVDFVETMYIMITRHGKGYYDMQGGAVDTGNPAYDALRKVNKDKGGIPKMGIGKDGGGVMVPLVAGRVGRGASATHLPLDPDVALKQFHALYRGGEIDDTGVPTGDREAARAVKFRKDPGSGKSLDQNLGAEPTQLHYLHPALSGGEVDPDHVRRIIRDRVQGKAGRDADAARRAAEAEAAKERAARERRAADLRRQPRLF